MSVGRKRRVSSEWRTDELDKKKNQLDALFVMARVTRTVESENIYRAYKKEYRSEVTRAKRVSIETFLDNSDNRMKAAWAVIRREMAGERNKDIKEIKAHYFNEFFCGAAGKIFDEIPGPRQEPLTFMSGCPRSTSSIYMAPTSPTEVLQIIRDLKASSTLDVYGLACQLLC